MISQWMANEPTNYAAKHLVDKNVKGTYED